MLTSKVAQMTIHLLSSSDAMVTTLMEPERICSQLQEQTN